MLIESRMVVTQRMGQVVLSVTESLWSCAHTYSPDLLKTHWIRTCSYMFTFIKWLITTKGMAWDDKNSNENWAC